MTQHDPDMHMVWEMSACNSQLVEEQTPGGLNEMAGGPGPLTLTVPPEDLKLQLRLPKVWKAQEADASYESLAYSLDAAWPPEFRRNPRITRQ